MTATKRTDPHTLANLNPHDYSCRMIFSLGNADMMEPPYNRDEAVAIYIADGASVHGGISSCDICGAHYRFGALFHHEPTGEVISVGWICAEKLDLAMNFDEASNMRENLKRLSVAARERAAKRDSLRGWVAENRELARALKTDHHIVRDIRATMIKWGVGAMTEKRAALVLKLRDEAGREPELHVAAPTPDGRIEITGEIVSAKPHESAYGSTMKMTVKVETPDGSWLAWGTIPGAITTLVWEERKAEREAEHDAFDAECERLRASEGEEAATKWARAYIDANPAAKDVSTGTLLKGRTITFEAALKPGNDEHFVFFKRPTKAKLAA